jgi:outer membrane protein OmpA-like peptidoglycan-associated protein
MRHWTASNRAALAACILGAAALTACTTTDPYTGQVVRNNTGTGALTGAAAGALLGYLTNTNKSSEGRKNALIGADAGGVAGNYMDRQQAELRREMAGTGVDVRREGDVIHLDMPSDVTFGVDRADLTPQAVSVLGDVARILNDYPQTTVDVVGHADSSGSDDYNLALSKRRASSVADYLVGPGRVLPDRLYVDGMGERAPIASNDTVEGRAKNRRVEVVVRPFTG